MMHELTVAIHEARGPKGLVDYERCIQEDDLHGLRHAVVKLVPRH